jgi:uncharacterized OB-fold protein
MLTNATPSDVEVLEAFPTAPIDQDNVDHYRGRLQRRLLVNRCRDCGLWHQPPKPVCPRCWSSQVEATEVSGRGKVALVTVLHVGTPTVGVDYVAGYPVVAVELEEQAGLRYVAGIVGCTKDDLYIGMPVELTWIERAGEPTPAFQPR